VNDLDAPLRRFLQRRPRPAAGEACDLCAAPIGDDHRHVADLEQRAIMCACRPCGLLFDGQAPSGNYRTVPDTYLRIAPFELSPTQWAALQIPVGTAFVVRNRVLQRFVAFYPSPGGATESELPLDAWADIVVSNPVLENVADDVEAVLLRGDRQTPVECFVVPVDRCYELVGLMRLHWRGFDGGQEVREAIAAFFDDVGSRARTVAGGVR
jgi:hypothetical protein